MESIPMPELVDRRVYRIRSRNLVVGAWRAESRGFIGIREKFGHLYLFEEFHYETGAPYGTAHAVEDLDVDVPPEIPMVENLDSLCHAHDRRVEWRTDEPESSKGRWYHLDDGSLVDRDQEDWPYSPMNQALFDLMRPFDEAIHAELIEQNRIAQIENESKRWAPKTLEQHEKDKRIEAVNSWRRAQLDAIEGVPDREVNKAIWDEFHDRMRKAIKGDA